MTPSALRDILTARRGRVPLDAIRKSLSWTTEESFREALDFLISCELAIAHEDGTFQAVRGCGKRVETGRTIYAPKEGQRPLGVLPRMSERCQAGGLQNGRNHRARQTAVIEEAIERLRQGVPRKLLKALNRDAMHRWKTQRPDDYRRILEAEEEGKRGVAA